MLVVKEKLKLRKIVREVKSSGKAVGFVPTMGALHKGHLSLVKIARKKNPYTVVSIFVNPTQFAPNEDLARYPRTLDQDLTFLEHENVDLVFVPTVDEMYSEHETITVHPGPVASTFEGKIRPTHFQGVLTVVAKLFNMVQPDATIFGQKDAQQLFLVRRMVADLGFPIDIHAGETERESDGLARSSRNVFLKGTEREQAAILYQALLAAKGLFKSGSRSLGDLQSAMREVTNQVSDFKLDYATVVANDSFLETDPLADRVTAIIAGKLGSVRLIDNVPLSSGK